MDDPVDVRTREQALFRDYRARFGELPPISTKLLAPLGIVDNHGSESPLRRFAENDPAFDLYAYPRRPLSSRGDAPEDRTAARTLIVEQSISCRRGCEAPSPREVAL